MLRGRVVADGDPLWLDSDRDLAVASELERRETHSCGHLVDDTFSPDSEGKYVVESLRCHACAAIAREQSTINSNPAQYDTNGLLLVARKVTDER